MIERFRLSTLLALVWLSVLLCSCASPTVVEPRKAEDLTLSCEQLEAEILDAEKFEAAARKERTVTGTNVAATLLFWPALIGTYSNTEDAINAATMRKANLLKIGEKKGCKFTLF